MRYPCEILNINKYLFLFLTNLILGSGELEFEEFCILAARFLIEEDEEQMKRELKEAFRFYDKEGKIEQLRIFKICNVHILS